MIRKDHFTQGFPAGLARWQSVLWISGIALIYFLAARFGLFFLFKPAGIPAIWLPSGIFLSAVLLTRRGAQPYLVAALFLTDLLCEVLAGIPPGVSLVYSLALTGEALLGAWLLRRFLGELPTFRKVKHVIGFLLLCILFSTALMAVVATLASTIFLKTPFWSSWLWWWSSDAVGSLLLTPLIMSLAFSIRTRFAEFKKWRFWRFIEGAVQLLLTAFLGNYVFSHFLSNNWFIPLLNFFIFPFLIWAAIRFGMIGTATTSTVLAVIILKYAIAGSFAYLGFASMLMDVILAQAYIALATIPSLFLAAVITERKQAEEIARSLARFPAENPNPVLRIARDGNLLYANEAAFLLLKSSELELGKSAPEMLREPALNVIAAKKVKTVDITCGERIFSISIAPALKGDDVTLYALDITKRKKAEEKLAISESELRALFASMKDLVIIYDKEGRYLNIATTNSPLLVKHPDDLIGKTIHEVFPKEEADRFTHHIQTVLETQRTMHIEYSLEINHNKVWFDASVSPLQEDTVIWVARDITDRKLMEEKSYFTGIHDNLTKLYNRAFLEEELTRLKKSRLFPVSIFMIDVDRLKIINDTQGHAAGDKILKRLAQVLLESFRSEDMVARIGGDEFVVVLPQTNADAAHVALNRINHFLELNNAKNDNKLKTSIGIATCNKQGSLLNAYKKADDLMYVEKHAKGLIS